LNYSKAGNGVCTNDRYQANSSEIAAAEQQDSIADSWFLLIRTDTALTVLQMNIEKLSKIARESVIDNNCMKWPCRASGQRGKASPNATQGTKSSPARHSRSRRINIPLS
jgi:hypothetical protein